jgi:hypothetical protein
MRLPMLDGDPLSVYLTDHHAGSTFGMELARRTRDENQGTDYGDFLARLATEIEEDRDSLEAIMRRLEVSADPVKVALAWTGEKIGRLKPNGSLVGYSPVSRLLELEALVAGVTGKLALWRALKELAPRDGRLDEAQLDRLAERAQRQLTALRIQQRRAARAALAGS